MTLDKITLLRPAYEIPFSEIDDHILLYSSESGHRLSYSLRHFREAITIEQRIVMVKLLHAFDVFCHDFGLNWFFTGGTLLGQFVFHGKIPWDDDMDVVIDGIHWDRMNSMTDQFVEKHTEFEFMKRTMGDGRSFYKLYFKGTACL